MNTKSNYFISFRNKNQTSAKTELNLYNVTFNKAQAEAQRIQRHQGYGSYRIQEYPNKLDLRLQEYNHSFMPII